MKNHHIRFRIRLVVVVLCLGMAMSNRCFAQYAASLVSQSVTNNTPIAARTVFTQTWTFQNTGTITWTPTPTGCTLDLTNEDCLGAISPCTNSSGTYHFPRANIVSGKNVTPGGQATFQMTFIAPEASGYYTDSFQLNGTNFFGPVVTAQIYVPPGGNTNQYDRARAVSYANNYAAYVCSDGTFWTNGGNYANFPIGVFTPAPVDTLGDDCAHFVSCCIGSTNVPGGGLKIPMRTPTYGEPGAARLVNNCLLAPGYAVEVSSLSQMEPGDVIGWNWEGVTNVSTLDHVTLYLGNSLIASHAISALDVGPKYFQTSQSVWHLIHILDVPTLNSVQLGNKFVMSWTTNWNKYALYTATSPQGPWSKVTGSHIVGNKNYVTNTIFSTANSWFFRLQMP
jgi:hypothetical protein